MDKSTDLEKLKTLAEWFDVRDQGTLYLTDKVNSESDEVQKDLRRIADKLINLEKEREELEEESKRLNKAFNDVNAEAQAFENKAKALEKELNQEDNNNRACNHDLKLTRQELQALKDTLSKLFKQWQKNDKYGISEFNIKRETDIRNKLKPLIK